MYQGSVKPIKTCFVLQFSLRRVVFLSEQDPVMACKTDLKKTKTRIDLTPVSDRDMDSGITMAPKKRRPENLVRFFLNISEVEEYEWVLSDGRIGGYVFHKDEPCVWLYTLDTDGVVFRNEMPHINFSIED